MKNMEQQNNKIQLSSKEILSHFFTAYYPQEYVVSPLYYNQVRIDKFISEIDASEVINNYSHYINIFLGANCSNSNKLYFEAIKRLFLSGENYKEENLKKLNIGFNFENIPNINLSNNDFSNYNFIWNFGDFLFQIYKNIYPYVYKTIAQKFYEARKEDEEEYIMCGVFFGESLSFVHMQLEETIKLIMQKLIPNIKNTNLQILIDLKDKNSSLLYELIEDSFKKGYFDGCYIKAVNCCPTFLEQTGLSKKEFEYYQYLPSKSLKKETKYGK